MIKCVSAIILIAVVPTMIYTDTVFFQPGDDIGKDAYVRELMPPQDQYGDRPYIYVGVMNCEHYISYLQFVELDDYLGNIDLIRATLTLRGVLNNTYILCYIDCADDEWSESSIRWFNRPEWNDDDEIYSEFMSPGSQDFVDVDVTDIVSSWNEGELDHYGFVIYSEDSSSYLVAAFAASEYYNYHPEHRPKLTIEFYYTDIEPTSLGEIKSLMK